MKALPSSALFTGPMGPSGGMGSNGRSTTAAKHRHVSSVQSLTGHMSSTSGPCGVGPYPMLRRTAMIRGAAQRASGFLMKLLSSVSVASKAGTQIECKANMAIRYKAPIESRSNAECGFLNLCSF